MLRWGREIHAQRWTESKEKLIKQKWRQSPLFYIPLPFLFALQYQVAVATGGVLVGVEVEPFPFGQAAEKNIAANANTVVNLYSSFIIPPGGILVSL
jgi:hypothetical protein